MSGEQREVPGSVLLIFSPWPRTGSSNIFLAQARLYSALGFQVRVLLASQTGWPTVDQLPYWTAALSGLSMPAVIDVAEPPYKARIRRRNPFPTLRWYLRGCPSVLMVRAEHVGASKLPRPWWIDLIRSRPQLIHCNHAFNLRLAKNLRNELWRRSGQRLPLIVDTHDILARSPATENPWIRRPDPIARIARDELELLGSSDLLIHISESDFDYFRTNIPRREHFFTPAVVSKPSGLSVNQSRRYDFEFLYVGNAHYSNGVSLAWFLRNLGAACRERGWRIAIVGTVDAVIRDSHPQLYEEFSSWFLGEVGDMTPIYARSRVVIAPSFGGTGSSVKVLEALAAGKPLVATPDAFRGFSKTIVLPNELAPAHSASEFVERMQAALQACGDWGEVGRRIFEDHFTEDHYRARMAKVLERVHSARVRCEQ